MALHFTSQQELDYEELTVRVPGGEQQTLDMEAENSGFEDSWTPASTSDNFKVVVRVRPPLARELRGSSFRPYQPTTYVEVNRNIIISENLQAAMTSSNMENSLHATYRFTFDHVYDQTSTQEDVYNNSAKHVVLSVLQGYNAAMIAYGQTGTGKTYTMEGDITDGVHKGIIPRTVEDIFTHILADPDPSNKYLVRASYLQIYNEVISDLLKPDRTNLTIREDKRRGVYVEHLSEWVVRSPGEVYQLINMGQSERATGATKLNEVSSRSHAVCIIIVERCIITADEQIVNISDSWSRPSTAQKSIKVGKLNLVDLAGSERVHVTGAVGKRLEESKKINASLSALGNVIAALTDKRERSHIPYRDSKLTRILEDSLGGNCKTTMICTIAPSLEAFQESLSTLKFANRAKRIKNDAHINEDLDQRTLLRKYERELRRLKAELQRRNKDLVDKRRLLEVEEQKRRAENDKLAALAALEKRSREFLKEKEEKRALEERIKGMQSQMLAGGERGQIDDFSLKAIIAYEHKKIRSDYEERLRQLEAERLAIQHSKDEADRRQELLIKQRNIMNQLADRLTKRDDTIQTLNQEIDVYYKSLCRAEDALDSTKNELFMLRRVVADYVASQGLSSGPLVQALGEWSLQGNHKSPSMNGTPTYPNSTPYDYSSQPDSSMESRPVEVVSETLSGLQLTGDAARRQLEEAEVLVRQLQDENMQLAEELAVLKHNGLQDPNGSYAEMMQTVSMLTEACHTAQNERAALVQILENKVCKLLSELLSEAAQQGSQQIVAKAQLLENIVGKIQDAIKNAPQII